MLWFNFILCLNFISLCFKLINIHYQTPKQREKKVTPRIKLNYNIYKIELCLQEDLLLTNSENKHYLRIFDGPTAG